MTINNPDTIEYTRENGDWDECPDTNGPRSSTRQTSQVRSASDILPSNNSGSAVAPPPCASTEMRNTKYTKGLDDTCQYDWFYADRETSTWTIPISLAKSEERTRDEVVERINLLLGNPKTFYDSPTGRYALKGDSIRVWSWDKGCSFTIAAATQELFEQFVEALDGYITVPALLGQTTTVHEIFCGPKGLESHCTYVEHDKIPTVHPELYPDIDIVALLEDYLTSPEPILILYGVPGVGKTCFMKHLMMDESIRSCYYVKDDHALESPQLWSMICSDKPTLVILDDLDNSLNPREGNPDSFLGKMLSATDGIFPTTTKYVISTNQNLNAIDSAIVRAGRCFDFFELNPLDRTEALTFWESQGFDKKTFESTFKGEVVTQADIMSNIFRLKKGFKARKYLKKGNTSYTVESKLHDLGISTDSVKTGFGR